MSASPAAQSPEAIGFAMWLPSMAAACWSWAVLAIWTVAMRCIAAEAVVAAARASAKASFFMFVFVLI